MPGHGPDHAGPAAAAAASRRRRLRAVAGGITVAAAALVASPAASAAAGHSRAHAAPAPHATASAAGESYSLLTNGGDLIGYGAALGALVGGASPSPCVGVAATPDGQGALIAEVDGAVVPRGDAAYWGSMAGTPLAAPIVGIAEDGVTGGYWLVASDGGVFAFHAPFLGSTGAEHLNAPIAGITAMPDGGGYRLVASDGGIFDFGDAHFYGSTGGIPLHQPIVGATTSPDGRGYWLVAADGGIFTFGDAHFRGSTGGEVLNAPIVAVAATPDGLGYWLVAGDGGIFTFGDASFYGAGGETGQKVVGIAPESGGYQDPLRDVTDLAAQRIDQGVDYAGSGPIYAIGDGVVLNTINAGWPGGAFITYQLLDGRAKGDIVYVAENVVPAVQIGQQVTPHTVLGTLVDAYPNLETGWAAPPGDGDSLAYASGQWDSYDDEHSVPTAYGENFSQLLASVGAPPGISYAAPSGTVPPDWPTW